MGHSRVKSHVSLRSLMTVFFSGVIPIMEESAGARSSQAAAAKATGLLRVEFVVNTYAELQPFVEMAVLLLESVFEHKVSTLVPTKTGKKKATQ